MAKFLIFFLIYFPCFVYGATQYGTQSGNINFDAGNDGNLELIIESDGDLALGTSSANQTLSINGNATISKELQTTDLLKDIYSCHFQIITEDLTLAGNSVILADSSANNITITLPTAASSTGTIYEIKKISPKNVVWVQTQGELIDLDNKLRLRPSTTEPQQLKIISNGSQWYILEKSNLVSPEASITSEPNLLAHWDFEENTGTTSTDSISSHVITLNNGATFGSGKYNNYALYFVDGTDDHAVLDAAASDLVENTPYTICFWMKSISDPDVRDAYISQSGGVLIALDNLGPQEYFVFTHISDALTPNIRPTISTWHHIAMSYASGTRNAYIDGVNVQNNSYPTDISAGGSIYLGMQTSLGLSYWQGLMDDLRIYNTALSQAEIDAIIAEAN